MKLSNGTWSAYEVPLNWDKGVHFIEVVSSTGLVILKEDVSEEVAKGHSFIEKRRFDNRDHPMRWRATDKNGKYLYGGLTWPL